MAQQDNWDELRQKIIGLGENSARKSYYPELQEKLADLQRYTALLDKTSDGIIQAEAVSGTIVQLNEAAAVMLKNEKNKLIGKSIFQFLRPDAVKSIKEVDLGEADIRIPSISLRTRLHTFPESHIDVELAVQVTEFQQKIYIVIIARDITEQKVSEDKIKESAVWLSILFDRSPIGIFVTDKNRIIIDANAAFCAMSGYEKNEIIGFHAKKLHVSEESAALFAEGRYEKVFLGERVRVEYQFKRKDNSFYWGELVGQSIFPDNPQRGTIWQIKEITERRLAEEARIEQEYRQKRYTALLSTLINTAIFSEMSSEKIFEQIAMLAGRIMMTERTGIWFFSQDLSIMHNECMYVLSENRHQRETLARSADVFWADTHQQTELLVFDDIKQQISDQSPSSEYYISLRIGAAIEAPVWVQGRLSAVISFENINAPRSWLIEEKQMAVTLAAYVANCIEANERKKAEKALRLSEERLRSFIEESYQGITIIDEYGYIEEWNHMAEQITGITRRDVIGKRWNDLALDLLPIDMKSNETEQRLEKMLLTAVSDESVSEPFSSEYPVKLKDGTLKYLEQRIFHIKTVNAFRIAGVFVDVTKRHEAEAALMESEEKFRSFAEQLADLVFLLDQNGCFQYLSPASKELFNVEPSEIVGRKFTEFLSQQDQIKVQEEFQMIIEGNKILRGLEITILRRDGTNFFGEISAAFYNERANKGVLGVLRDISKRKLTEANLLRLSKGIEQSSAIFMITDPHGIIEYVNPKFTEITGYASNEVIGKTPRLLKSGKTSRQEYKDLWKTIKSGREWRGEFFNKKKNGEYFWEQTHISPVFNEKGEVMSFVAIKEDITEKKEMIRELIAARDKAEEMNRIKSSFLANMSHELRTPLIGILGYAEIIRDEKVEPEIATKAGVIFKSGMRLLDTLNQILNLSKIEADKLEIELQEIDVIPVVEEIVELFREAAQKKNLYLDYRSNLLSAFSLLDKRLLTQILNNLVNNALKFTSQGGVELIVKSINHDGADYIKISIVDTGIGISKEDQIMIWEEFRQVSEGINREYEGTGLGLTLTRQYIQRLDGIVELESEPGKGSVFSVSFKALLIRNNSLDE